MCHELSVGFSAGQWRCILGITPLSLSDFVVRGVLKKGVTNGVTKTNVEMFDRHVIYIVFVYFRQLKRSCIYFLIFCSGRRLILLSEQWIEIFF